MGLQRNKAEENANDKEKNHNQTLLHIPSHDVTRFIQTQFFILHRFNKFMQRYLSFSHGLMAIYLMPEGHNHFF